jgi:hypothetical protein
MRRNQRRKRLKRSQIESRGTINDYGEFKRHPDD